MAIAVGNGTVTAIAQLVAPGTIAGSGAVTFPGGIVIAGTLTGGTSINGTAVAVGQGTPPATLGYYVGTGVPTFSAANGSHYLRYDGTSGSLVYYNTSGASTSGTTWSAQAAP